MSAAAKTPGKKPSVLPPPPRIVEHHLKTLSVQMSEWSKTKRVPPALLLTGPEGVGKRSMGYFLAQWLLCERSSFRDSSLATGQGPCGQCLSCQRALHETWVDFREILPESDDTEGRGSPGNLKIDQFRELKESLGFGAHEGQFKIVFIPNAERMTAQASNSMLKLLEEPPPGWLFFLTASDPTLMLPTMLSRCQVIRLRPLGKETLQALLSENGVSAAASELCAELAQGSWSKALAFSGEELWAQRKAVLDFLSEPAAELSRLVDWAAQHPSHLDFLLDQMEHLSADLLRWSVSESEPDSFPWANADAARILSAHARDVTRLLGSRPKAREFWIDRSERIARARRNSRAPLNRKLLVQELLIPELALGSGGA